MLLLVILENGFGFHLDVSLGNAMVDMFGKCKYVDGARLVFDAMAMKDVVSCLKNN